jgi:ribonuclease III
MSSSGQNFEFIKVSNIERVEKIIGYTFKNKALLQQALTHRSYLNEKDKNQDITEHNERLEYLGDAVLELIVSDYLYNDLDESEGKMTKLRSALVKDENTAKVGISIGLQSEILLSRGEREELGTARPSIVADVVEALLGAMYLDGGMEPSIHFIHMYILTLLPEIIEVESYNDYKTLMQEFTQKYTKITPHYKVITTEGKDHNKVYVCGLWVDNEKISEGSGKSKQIAETQAAKKSLLIMQARYKEDV